MTEAAAPTERVRPDQRLPITPAQMDLPGPDPFTRITGRRR